MSDEEIPEEGKLVLGAITVVSWILFVGGYVLVEEMERRAERTAAAAQAILDRDYLLPFRDVE
ncbi:MAG: hypothetical protein L0191_07975 [Acidobacteria bacterium]|nr:hypothetical protein [Acidobacteriota bacterium]